MWPFQRKAEAPVDSGSRPVPAPVIRRDWSGLPPIQRLIGAHPLTAPSDRFSNDLATHHDPSVSTEPMGHQVSAEAPAGIVLALARPTMRNDGPAMISRPRVQRRVQGAIEESGEWDGDEAAPPAARPSPLPAGGPPSAVRELPVVAAAPVAQRLTTLSADIEPIPVETAPRRSRIEPIADWPAVSRADAPDGPVPPPRLTLGQARRLGLGAPIKRVPDRSVQRASAETTEMPLAASPPPQPSLQKLERELPGADLSAPSPAGPSGAPRLELPLATRESARIPQPDPPPQVAVEFSGDSPVQRATDVSAEPSADRAAGAFTDTATSGRTEIGVNPVPAMPLVQPSLHRELPPRVAENLTAPTLPSPASGGGESSASIASAPPRPSPANGGVGFAAFPARGEGAALAPLVGGRPLRPTTLQRSPAPGRFDLQEEIGGAGGSDATDVVASQALQRSAYTQPLDPKPSSNGSFASMPTRSLLSAELTHLSPQPRYSPTLSDRAVAVGRRLQVQTQSEPLVDRGAELPLAPVQRAAHAAPEPLEPGGESAFDVVQRQWPDTLSPVASSAPTQGPSPAEVGSGFSNVGSVPASHTAPETDMDELAGKLYDKIRTRLKSELLVDRERAGFLTDLR